MSVRAYRVNKIERAENPSFNLWHDEAVINFLNNENSSDIQNSLNYDGGGMIEISIESLQKLLRQKKIKLEDYHKEAIKEDIEFAKKNRDNYLLYDCF